METVEAFYDDLAAHYHLIFEDWDKSIAEQSAILGPLLESYTGLRSLRILDCACGIGIQTLGLAQRGHTLVASDLSRASVARALREARLREADVRFHVADMRNLSGISEGNFDAVLAADNALPHLLLDSERDRALQEMANKLRPGGIMVASIRDYDFLINTRPAMQPPSFFGDRGCRRIVHQVWDWDGAEYDLHLHIAFESPAGWNAKHYVSRYRALLREDLAPSFQKASFIDIQWLEPESTSFYQPIVIARKPA